MIIATRARQLLGSKFVQDTLILQIGKIAVTLLSAVSTIVVTRLMGPESYGFYRQSDNFYNLWRTLDLTGVSTSTSTRLGIAVGERNRDELLNLMAFYVQISMATTLTLALLLGILGPVAAQLLQGDSGIGVLAALLALTGPGDAFYNLVTLTFQSRRAFRTLALLQNINQFVLTASMIAAVLLSPTAAGLIVARLFYSYSTMLLALIVYARERSAQSQPAFPPMLAVLKRAARMSPRPYWRFGVANALDKNASNLYTTLPILLVGSIGGSAAVGYLSLALTGIAQASVLTSAVFDNMQAVVPQLVGRRDYARLWRNFLRVLGVLVLGGVGFYGVMALLAPVVIPPLFGAEWLPAIPVLLALCIYGAVTTFGGIFGPLYRAFGMMKAAFGIKLIALALALPVGVALLNSAARLQIPFWGWSHYDSAATAVAVSGAWTINLLFIISVGLTMTVMLPALRRRALADTSGTTDVY